ncbi:MAG: hypothetical protein CVT63_02045 [Candidatus Anoxymicrobium japonicum]|uniref:AAA+ ATPase domain-containing protein n=1 Tax=Candidatus Anoxymicrobium japonicum TaxID=2013648 RepID=A0A2N3G791_9ACTN|nr:MAG: hypothetical protein CVT63_02045 [Candidatus Anoxymicrobium japonicum]
MQHSERLIPRTALLNKVLQALDEAPVTILTGARQTGKTTLAQMVVQHYKERGDEVVTYFDLERAADQAAISTPELTLEPLRGLVVIDEIQRMPELFSALRPLADRPRVPARFLALGSASPGLVRGVSESLAGRALFVHVPGLNLCEVGFANQETLWTRGGFPRALLAEREEGSFRWREAFVASFLERDIPQLGFRIPSVALRRFWTMLAHYHGRVWNASELARSIGSSSKTALHYRDILEGSYMIRVLPPWFANLKKRQVKSPKVYVRDSGLLHSLLWIPDMNALRAHPQYGVSWEGFALEQVLGIIRVAENAYFWSTQCGAELDLLVFREGKAIGFEFKCTDAPSMTKSMHVALQDLNLEILYVVYPGSREYDLHEKVKALPLRECGKLKELLANSSTA